jgi:serine/threonine protein kinase
LPATLPPPPAPARPPLETLLDRLSAPHLFAERYEMISTMHGGGMGEIWRAKDRLLGREVAVKVAHAGLAESPAAREQFLKEARIGGRLLHPNVLPVFDVGITPQRQLYFTMRFVNGESLRRSLDAIATACSTNLVEFPLTKIVEAFGRVCRGVDFAHQNRVIHLDLKPDNVLVSGFDEVFVIDWGLARVDGEDDLARLYELYGTEATDDSTRCGYNESGRRVVGTPGFMSPEQVEGDPKKFGQPTDVFGLGGILYYLLYGNAPCRPAGVSDFLEVMRATLAPQRPGRLREGILPRGQRVRKERADFVAALERICLKCLERDPRERYLRVEDLIIDLGELKEN